MWVYKEKMDKVAGANQEAGPYQTLNLWVPFNLQNYEK